MVSCKRISTSLNVDEDGGLICTMYSPSEKSWESQYLYSIRLMKLKGDEFNLNGGRFKMFRLEHQPYRIVLPQETIGWYDRSAAIVEWIAENIIDTTWSMQGVAQSAAIYTDLEFSFSDSIAAVHFALRWR